MASEGEFCRVFREEQRQHGAMEDPDFSKDLAGRRCLKILSWHQRYSTEQAVMCRAILLAYNAFADSFLSRPKLPAELQDLFRRIKTQLEEL
jgi:hypothetical protein